MPHTLRTPRRVLPPYAVIDIGSNSVRLVVFDGLRRSPLTLYNEKILCGLGHGIGATGALDPVGVVQARQGIARFIAIARHMQVHTVHLAATAAVREATDGPAFVQALEAQHGLPVEIVSGDEEARLAALAVHASFHAPDGLVCDMGGGSLEIAEVRADPHAPVGRTVSLPLGGLRLLDDTGGHQATVARTTEDQLRTVRWLEQNPKSRTAEGPPPSDTSRTLYVVGGSFRALAKLHIARQRYPLHVVHQYTVSSKQFLPFLRRVAAMPAGEAATLPDVPSRRGGLLPVCAQVLLSLMERCKARQVCFSASGIREGLVYRSLPAAVQAEDGLISACRDMAGHHDVDSTYGEELYHWMAPLFVGETVREARLRHAACLLSGLAWWIHPENRAEWVMETIMRAALWCLDHRDRAALAYALYHRHVFKPPLLTPYATLTDETSRAWGRRVGTAAALAHALSGSVRGVLRHCPLQIGPDCGTVHVQAPEALRGGVEDGEELRKRLDRVQQLQVGALQL